MERERLSEMLQNNHVCGAKTKQGICKNPPMKNGRCPLHGGLTPKKHPNHNAKLNTLKTGRYSKELQQQIDKFKLELRQLGNIIISSFS